MTNNDTVWLVAQGGGYDGTSVKAAYESRDEAIAHAEGIEFHEAIYTTGETERHDRDDGSILIRHLPDSVVTVNPVDVKRHYSK